MKYLLTLLVILVPLFWIMGRAVSKSGFSRWWALLGFVPLANVVALWVFAFSKWPNLPEQ